MMTLAKWDDNSDYQYAHIEDNDSSNDSSDWASPLKALIEQKHSGRVP